ncbi:MAG: hypothetical protein ABIF77_00455, partial [bacterium]
VQQAVGPGGDGPIEPRHGFYISVQTDPENIQFSSSPSFLVHYPDWQDVNRKYRYVARRIVPVFDGSGECIDAEVSSTEVVFGLPYNPRLLAFELGVDRDAGDVWEIEEK